MNGACACVLECHGYTLRPLADELGVHITGLAHGAALMRKCGCGSPRLWPRLRALDTTAAFPRHVNRPQCASFRGEVPDELKALTKPNTNPDTVLRADEYVTSVPVTEFVTPPAATHAATASLSPVNECVAPTPTDLSAARAHVIEHVMPAPVVITQRPFQ